MTDFQCHLNCDDQAAHASHDPAQCRRDAAKDGTCSSSGVNLPSCTYSTQCSSGNRTDGRCYGNANGQRCTYSTQCSSGNCTDGCCSGNGNGSACTYSTQCTSGTCSNGHCQ